jgi:hypothetical protein
LRMPALGNAHRRNWLHGILGAVLRAILREQVDLGA